MENSGYNCANINKRVIERGKSRRKKYKTIEEFLEAEQRNPMKGTNLLEKETHYISFIHHSLLLDQ